MTILRSVVPPLITLVLVLAVWAYATRSGGLPSYLLPDPLSVGRALWAGLASGEYAPHIQFTLTSTLLGYGVGSVAAVAAGILVAESRAFERFVFPYIVAIQAMPKVALAPLILVWFGFGLASKVVLVALICFFPLLVNTIAGIRRTDPELIDMARSFSRPPWWIFLHVKLPAAAGAIFAGLEIGIVLALIGAIVGEFVAAEKGVGYLIGSATVNMNVSTMFAGVLMLAGFGIVGSALVRLAQRRIVFWEQSTGQSARGERA
ncbi:ABC transporter permease (plasmid) [Methylobacterium sp. NMS14P]|uniref:ABC transporter permease n=1 Tax=Methylobacterium sp. NMS14P TaxID=2894310 RepID=UPI002358991E|nr:ABC transporter permease [Methylobacterium sp. NMS14P]WCS28707.1 ABC transporter permease [Methylobacterium sp. NMS14P]